jgi:hypothetical protein
MDHMIEFIRHDGVVANLFAFRVGRFKRGRDANPQGEKQSGATEHGFGARAHARMDGLKRFFNGGAGLTGLC